MLRSCTDRELTHSLLGCREHFDLYLQKGTTAEGLEWDPEDEITIKNFKKLATISSDTKWSADTSQSDAVTSWLIRFKPMVHQSWIRLAVRDEGACLMLDRIRIYYLSCPAWQVCNLIFL
ncbi:unnamed protein product [Dibothriocephalus latus]|uniref:Eph LBD domain-containing protein n=1 Tax=Dibothriocephalus latus TaxID=60516 RepID=A0A3P6TNJ8_DIBLA|nr:unnamed protein product [Dibothriocephalus latus]